MSSLGIGTATFSAGYGLAPDTPSPVKAAALLREAFAAGIDYVDTAAGYGDAESVVGQVAAEIADRRVRVCTKIAAAGVTSLALGVAVRASLSRLRLETLDTLLLHSVSADVFAESALVDGLADIRHKGLAKRIGCSTYGIADARSALQQPWCGALQVEHSVLNPSVLSGIVGSTGQTEIIARSALCKGLLTSRRRYAGDVLGELAPTLDALDRLAAEWGWPLPELAIRFALDTPGVDVVVVGISTDKELETAVMAAKRPPLGVDALKLLAGFNRSYSDAAHPERWALVGSDGGSH